MKAFLLTPMNSHVCSTLFPIWACRVTPKICGFPVAFPSKPPQEGLSSKKEVHTHPHPIVRTRRTGAPQLFLGDTETGQNAHGARRPRRWAWPSASPWRRRRFAQTPGPERVPSGPLAGPHAGCGPGAGDWAELQPRFGLSQEGADC